MSRTHDAQLLLFQKENNFLLSKFQKGMKFHMRRSDRRKRLTKTRVNIGLREHRGRIPVAARRADAARPDLFLKLNIRVILYACLEAG